MTLSRKRKSGTSGALWVARLCIAVVTSTRPAPARGAVAARCTKIASCASITRITNDPAKRKNSYYLGTGSVFIRLRAAVHHAASVPDLQCCLHACAPEITLPVHPNQNEYRFKYRTEPVPKDMPVSYELDPYYPCSARLPHEASGKASRFQRFIAIPTGE